MKEEKRREERAHLMMQWWGSTAVHAQWAYRGVTNVMVVAGRTSYVDPSIHRVKRIDRCNSRVQVGEGRTHTICYMLP